MRIQIFFSDRYFNIPMVSLQLISIYISYSPWLTIINLNPNLTTTFGEPWLQQQLVICFG